MKNKMKKILSLILCVTMAFSLATPAFAEDEDEHEHIHAVLSAADGETDADDPSDDAQQDADSVLPDEGITAKPIITVTATETDKVNGGASPDNSVFCYAPIVTVTATEGRTIASVTVTRNSEEYILTGVELNGQTVVFTLELSSEASAYKADTFTISAVDNEGDISDIVTIQVFGAHSWLNKFNGKSGTRNNTEYPATCTSPAYPAQNYYCGICGEMYFSTYLKPKADADGSYDSLPESQRPTGHKFTETSVTSDCGTYTKKDMLGMRIC